MKNNLKKILSLFLIASFLSLTVQSIPEINASTKPITISKKNFPDKNFRTYVKKFDKNKDGKLSTKEITKVKKMVLDGDRIDDIKELVTVSKIKSLKGINTFSNLTRINIVNSNITSLNLSLPKLTYLNIDCPSLKTFKLSNGKYLENIQIYNYNEPFKLDCGKFQNLKSLVIAGDAEIIFDDLCLEKCTKLSFLSLFNQLKADEIDLTKFTELMEIYFVGTAKKLDVSGLEKLEMIDASEMGIEELNISGCSSLKSLYCRRNKLKKLDISGLDKIENLYCDKDVEIIGETDNIPNVRKW